MNRKPVTGSTTLARDVEAENIKDLISDYSGPQLRKKKTSSIKQLRCVVNQVLETWSYHDTYDFDKDDPVEEKLQ